MSFFEINFERCAKILHKDAITIALNQEPQQRRTLLQLPSYVAPYILQPESISI